MTTQPLPEVWLRGPVTGVPALLQPAAHALLQAKQEITGMLKDFPQQLLWKRPAGLASAGFHLQHMKGVIDRMQSYANQTTLTEEQFAYLKAEGVEDVTVTPEALQEALSGRIDLFVEWLKQVPEESLTEVRTVGRRQLPSTTIGLLFHAAEHTMRHTGQLLVTVQVLKQGS